jgi:hypothetical protein
MKPLIHEAVIAIKVDDSGRLELFTLKHKVKAAFGQTAV